MARLVVAGLLALLTLAAGGLGAARLWGPMVGCLLAGGALWAGVLRAQVAAPSGAADLRLTRLALVLGVALRLTLALLGPEPTRDLTRYRWDGHLVAQGVSPYLSTPAAPEHREARAMPTFADLEHVDVPTVYPPLSQLIFGALWALGGGRTLVFRLGFALADCLALWLLWRALRTEAPGRIALYALCPLGIFEAAQHQDALVAPGIAALLTLRPALAGAGGALAVLAKGHALLLLPRLARPLGIKGLAAALVVALLCSAPFLAAGLPDLTGMSRYLRGWIGYTPLWPTLRALGMPVRIADGLCLSLVLGVAAAVALRPSTPARDARNVLGAALWCSKIAFPWYAISLLPALTLAPSLPWLVWVALLPLIYLPHLGLWPGADRVWVPLLLYGLPLLLALAAHGKRADQPV
jgi:hypothetical protein